MKTSEFTRIVLGVWLKGDYSPYMCDCIHEVSRKIAGVYEIPAAEKLVQLIQEAGISGFRLVDKFEDDTEGLAEFRQEFLLNAIKHFESIND